MTAPPESKSRPTTPKGFKAPTRLRGPRHAPQYVLVLTDSGSALQDKRGTLHSLTPGSPADRKLRGTVHVVDLTGLADTTFVPTPGMTPKQMTGAVTLSPEQYLPSSVEDAALAVLPTTDDQGHSAALIAYANGPALTAFSAQLAATGLRLLSIESAALTALHRAPTEGGAAIITSSAHQHVALVVNGGQVIARIRKPASARQDERVDQLYEMLSDSAGVLHSQDVTIGRIVLMADPPTAERLSAELGHGTSDFTLEVLTETDLARLGFQSPALPLTPGKAGGAASSANLGGYLPLLIGVAAAALPVTVISALNHLRGTQLSDNQTTLDALSPQLNEYAALNAHVAQVRAAQSQVKAIKDNRVNWAERLTTLTDQLPQDAGAYAVKFQTLQALAAPPPPPPPSPNNAASTPGTPVTSNPLNTPTGTPGGLPAPRVTYTFTARAASKAALTSAISTLERTYALNLTTLRRDATTTSWLMQASATEKPPVMAVLK